jgi:hypothetical protein
MRQFRGNIIEAEDEHENRAIGLRCSRRSLLPAITPRNPFSRNDVLSFNQILSKSFSTSDPPSKKPVAKRGH